MVSISIQKRERMVISVILKFEYASESPNGLVKTPIPGTYPQSF